MPQPDIVSDYLDTLTRALGFDRRLAQRVRQEVEDHLLEAVAAEPEDDTDTAQLRAVQNFGDAHSLAGEYAAQSLLHQSRRVGTVALCVASGILVAMNVRGAWYGWMQWSLSAELQTVRKIGLRIDLYAFVIALALGLAGWAYLRTRRRPARFDAPYRDQMKRSLLLWAVAAAPLIATVVSDAVLTGLRLHETGLHPAALVPLVTMAGEIAFAAVLVSQLRSAIKRTALAASLFCG